MKALLVEPNSNTAANLRAFLSAQGIRLATVNCGQEAIDFLGAYTYDLMVLSLALPDMDGTTLIRCVRSARKEVPILALAAALHALHRVAVFAAGADDVVTQPVDRAELVARMHAIVRRSRGHSEPTLRLGELTLHLERHDVIVGDRTISVTGKEFAILKLLMLRRNMILTKEAILANIYSGMDEPEPKIIDVFICKLRRKLEQAGAPEVISTVWGRGYTVRDLASDGHSPPIPHRPPPGAQHPPSTLVPA